MFDIKVLIPFVSILCLVLYFLAVHTNVLKPGRSSLISGSVLSNHARARHCFGQIEEILRIEKLGDL